MNFINFLINNNKEMAEGIGISSADPTDTTSTVTGQDNYECSK